jgi:hypothetical protein
MQFRCPRTSSISLSPRVAEGVARMILEAVGNM